MDASTVSKTNLRYNKAVTNVGTLSLYYDLIHNTDMDMVMEITECHLYNLSPVRDTLGYRDYANAKGHLFGKDGVLHKSSNASYIRQYIGSVNKKVNVEGRGVGIYDVAVETLQLLAGQFGMKLTPSGLKHTINAGNSWQNIGPLFGGSVVDGAKKHSFGLIEFEVFFIANSGYKVTLKTPITNYSVIVNRTVTSGTTGTQVVFVSGKTDTEFYVVIKAATTVSQADFDFIVFGG